MQQYNFFLLYAFKPSKKPFFVAKKLPLLCFIFTKNLKVLYAIFACDVRIASLRAKNLYWWGYFYNEAALFLPSTYFIDEICLLSRAEITHRYTYWDRGSLHGRSFRRFNYKYLKGSAFHSEIYTKYNPAMDPRVLKLYGAFYRVIYFLTIML